MTEKPEGPIILWEDGGYDGWSHKSYPTIREALEAERYHSRFIITRLVDYEITEKPASDG